ncbi:hypothetical protein ACWD9K_36135 [Streptomyces sp. 900116325]
MYAGAAVLFREGRHREPAAPARTPWPATLALAAAAVLGIVSQLVLHLAGG